MTKEKGIRREKKELLTGKEPTLVLSSTDGAFLSSVDYHIYILSTVLVY